MTLSQATVTTFAQHIKAQIQINTSTAMEAPWTTSIFSSCAVPLLLVAVIILLIAILVNVHRTKTLTAGTAEEKEPEEHDERFATSKFVKY